MQRLGNVNYWVKVGGGQQPKSSEGVWCELGGNFECGILQNSIVEDFLETVSLLTWKKRSFFRNCTIWQPFKFFFFPFHLGHILAQLSCCGLSPRDPLSVKQRVQQWDLSLCASSAFEKKTSFGRWYSCLHCWAVAAATAPPVTHAADCLWRCKLILECFSV